MARIYRAISASMIVGFMVASCAVASSETSDKPEVLAETPVVSTTPAPDWTRTNIGYMTAGSGQWVADNAAYKSDTEAWDAYVIEWTAGPDDLSMTARMYGLQDGCPSQADFWSFYQFWDHAARDMRIIQSGWGVVGDGAMDLAEDGTTLVSEQIFSAPGQAPRAVRHETVTLSPTEHQTRSLNRSEKGEWVTDRSYVWTRTLSDEPTEAAAD